MSGSVTPDVGDAGEGGEKASRNVGRGSSFSMPCALIDDSADVPGAVSCKVWCWGTGVGVKDAGGTSGSSTSTMIESGRLCS